MVTRHIGLAGAALVLTTCVATGCSEQKTPAARTQPSKPSAAAIVEKGEPGAPVPAATTGVVSFAEGEAAYEARNYPEAARLFGAYAEQRPDQAWGHFMHGLSAWKSGDLPRAEAAFDDALRLDPDHVKSLVNLSRVLLDAKRPGEAIARLERAAELDAASSDVQRLLGRAYHAQGDPDKAKAAYQRALDRNHTDAWAMNNMGLLLLEEGRSADALPLLARAVELRKDVATFQNNLGMALEHTGRFSAAAAAYGGALTADSGYEKARQNLARVEKVKESASEPFDLEAEAKRFADDLEARHVKGDGVNTAGAADAVLDQADDAKIADVASVPVTSTGSDETAASR